MRILVLLLFLAPFILPAQNAFPPVGQWREHLPYHGVVDVAGSENLIFAATPYSLFTVESSTREVQRLSRVSGLSETGISTIAFDAVSNKLFVAYSNSNVDVLTSSAIHNIPDIKRTQISGDKTIYHIYPDNNRCYLSTGIGIVVLDAVKYEVKDSWFIGDAGDYVKTNGFVKTPTHYFAATEEGLKMTAVTNPNPADFQTWQKLSGVGGLPLQAAQSVVALQDQVFVLQNDTVYSGTPGNWNYFYGNGMPVSSINTSGNHLIICQTDGSAGQVAVMDAAGLIINTLSQPGITSRPRRAISRSNGYWLADQFGGLSYWNAGAATATEIFRLDSPTGVATGQLIFSNDVFYAAAGTVNAAWNYQYNRTGIFRMQHSNWWVYNQYSYQALDTLMDFIAVATDPRDGSLWAGSFGGGLLHVLPDNQVEVFKQNAPLGSTVGDPLSYRISGLAFDRNNNLWISNYGSVQALHVLKSNGSWQSFTVPFFLDENATAGIVIDEADQKWIISPRGNGLLVLNDNGTIDNTSDDQWRLYRAGAGSGNLPSSEVMSLALDKSGFLWVGTNNGIGVIQCPESVFFNGCEAVLPVISEGGFANYLFKGEEVRSIAVDGADRKWVATSSGAWLINPDGDKVLAHFTEANSPLLSNDVKSIAINGRTGEVFFATAKGISSYRAGATEAAETKNDVLVFPNPVPPGYNGTIAVRGLPENSIFKIVETGGRLVYQARSLGGQAVWNGRDYRNRPVSSGVYLVMAVDQQNREKVVAKIVFISR